MHCSNSKSWRPLLRKSYSELTTIHIPFPEQTCSHRERNRTAPRAWRRSQASGCSHWSACRPQSAAPGPGRAHMPTAAHCTQPSAMLTKSIKACSQPTCALPLPLSLDPHALIAANSSLHCMNGLSCVLHTLHGHYLLHVDKRSNMSRDTCQNHCALLQPSTHARTTVTGNRTPPLNMLHT